MNLYSTTGRGAKYSNALMSTRNTTLRTCVTIVITGEAKLKWLQHVITLTNLTTRTGSAKTAIFLSTISKERRSLRIRTLSRRPTKLLKRAWLRTQKTLCHIKIPILYQKKDFTTMSPLTKSKTNKIYQRELSPVRALLLNWRAHRRGQRKNDFIIKVQNVLTPLILSIC